MEQKKGLNLIKVSKEDRQKLMKIFGVGKGTISMALNGYRDSETSKKIRHTALTQFNGIELAPVTKDDN